MFFDLINILTFLLTGLSAIATIYLALQIAYMRKLYVRESLANQMQRTIQAIQLPPEVNKTITEVLHMHYLGSAKSFNDMYKNLDIEKSNSIASALVTLETLATGILSDVYNEEIAYKQLGYSLPVFYDVVQGYVYQSRESYLSISQFVQLEMLARRWQNRDKYSYTKKGGLL